MYRIYVKDIGRYIKDMKFPHPDSEFKSELHAESWLKTMLREDKEKNPRSNLHRSNFQVVNFGVEV